MSDYENFKTELERAVNSLLDSAALASLGTSKAVNTGRVDVLRICGNTEGELSPQYHLEGLYRQYREGRDLDEIARLLVTKYQETNAGKEPFIEKRVFDSFEAAKDRIYYRVLNTERNREYLEDAVCGSFLDLTVEYCIFVGESESGIGNVMLTKSILGSWGVSVEDVRKAAAENTEKLFPLKKRRLYDMLADMLAELGNPEDGSMEDIESLLFGGEKEGNGPVILTNRQGINGFGTILYKDSLKARRSNKIYRSEKYPFMIADVDRLIVGTGEDGTAGLECKTASPYSAEKWQDGKIPAHYLAQCHHYMAVLGAGAWYVAVVIYGRDFKWIRIERDEEIIKDMVQIERDFWERHVMAGILPEPDGSGAADSFISCYFRTAGRILPSPLTALTKS